MPYTRTVYKSQLTPFRFTVNLLLSKVVNGLFINSL